MRISTSKVFLWLAFSCIVPATGFTEEKSYLWAINEVYECVAVTGCSRISIDDANLVGGRDHRHGKEAAAHGPLRWRTSRGRHRQCGGDR